jgi:hypothetical protein
VNNNFELYRKDSNKFFFLDARTDKEYTFEIDGQGIARNFKDLGTGRLMGRFYSKGLKGKLQIQDSSPLANQFCQMLRKAGEENRKAGQEPS